MKTKLILNDENLTCESYVKFVSDWKALYKKISAAIRSKRLASKNMARASSKETFDAAIEQSRAASVVFSEVRDALPDNFPVLEHPYKVNEVVSVPFAHDYSNLATYLLALRKTSKVMAQEAYLKHKEAVAA